MTDIRECIRRAARTFLQAAIGCAAAGIAGLAESGALTGRALSALLIPAVAAGLAALMNLPHRAADSERNKSAPNGGDSAETDRTRSADADSEAKEEHKNEQTVQGN